MKQFIILAIALAFVCCKNASPSRISPVGDNFLVGEWMMDSIVGKKEWKQDWVYFTDDNKYWRFSKYNESYLIEKELSWQGDSIFSDDLTHYRIIPVDSQRIILDNGNEKFLCRRWGDFDREDINRFMKENPIKEKINGAWILENAENFPVEIPSFCNNLKKGTEIQFQPDGTALVLPTDTTENTYCDSYGYSVNFWDEPELSLQESDMIISYRILKLNEDELIIIDKNMPMGNLSFSRKKE